MPVRPFFETASNSSDRPLPNSTVPQCYTVTDLFPTGLVFSKCINPATCFSHLPHGCPEFCCHGNEDLFLNFSQRGQPRIPKLIWLKSPKHPHCSACPLEFCAYALEICLSYEVVAQWWLSAGLLSKCRKIQGNTNTWQTCVQVRKRGTFICSTH